MGGKQEGRMGWDGRNMRDWNSEGLESRRGRMVGKCDSKMEEEKEKEKEENVGVEK